MKAIVDVPFKGAPDGEIYAKEFAKGDPVHGDLARVAVKEKWATEVQDDLPLGEVKDAGASPENKAIGNAPENKRKPRHK
jgi:hypothetical protein